jgi:LytS/YehU family sensor histidine kinase
MLLLPLIENSFKYGIMGDVNNTFININLTQKEDEFVFDIENNFSNGQLESNVHSGLGLENIQKNLEIVYSKTHEFKITKTKDSFRVTLKLYNHED